MKNIGKKTSFVMIALMLVTVASAATYGLYKDLEVGNAWVHDNLLVEETARFNGPLSVQDTLIIGGNVGFTGVCHEYCDTIYDNGVLIACDCGS